jgi:hypothetical protein
MTWPTIPTCHKGAWPQPHLPLAWREPRVDLEYGQVPTFRTCSYCGSIHPADLAAALESGAAKLGGSDWKYGWPHKFYVEGMPNLFEGAECRYGTSSKWEGGVHTETPLIGKPTKTIHAKWYNEHLLDEGYGEAERGKLIVLLEEHAGILFIVEGGRLQYRAPHAGYQR